jgi:hypothetical protein
MIKLEILQVVLQDDVTNFVSYFAFFSYLKRIQYKKREAMEYWSIGVLDKWSIGVMEQWSYGVLEYWSIACLSADRE